MTAFIPVDQFDPNQPPKGLTLWGVWDGYSFHVTTRRASAIQKVYKNSACSVWELDPTGVWLVRGSKHTDIKPGMSCQDCGMQLQQRQSGMRWARYSRGAEGDWQFTRGRGGKIVNPLELLYRCEACCDRNES